MFSQGYLIDTQLCVTALWLFYILLLHRRISLSAARTYLLCLLPVSMLLPLLRIPLLPAVPTSTGSQIIYIQEIIPGEMPAIETSGTVTFADILLWVYLLGSAVMLIVAGINILRTYRHVRRAKQAIIFSPAVAGAFSVFGTIFINDKYEGSPLLGQILAHEQSHIDHCHSADLVWLNLWRCLLWFNPIAWHTLKLLRQVHEFQADRAVIRCGYPAMPYIDLLIGTEVGIYPGTANTLCYSLTKKRLKMIAQFAQGKNRKGYMRLAMLPVLTGALLCAFSLTARAAAPSEPEAPQPAVPTETLPADTIQEVAVQVKRILDTLDLQLTPLPKAESDAKKINYLDLDVQPDTAKQRARGNQDSKQQPIFVIDGVISATNPLSPGPNEINANNYESVTVLKGAAAKEAYGEKGINGVIVITTKKVYHGTYQALTADSAVRIFRAQHETAPRRSVLIKQESQNGLVQSKLVINNGRIIMNPESDQAGSTGQTITINLSKRDKKRGITVNSKLLKKYPELFYTADDGSVTNREPVSIYIYDAE